MDALDLAWLAGLLEGEGSFGLKKYKRKRGGERGYPIVKVKMTDRDVVERAAVLFGDSAVLVCPPPANYPHHKVQYRTEVTGSRARQMMCELRPMLGLRRQAQVDTALSWQH
jgi:hypothetical protein